MVLVGAQAVYLRAGEADLAVSPFTTDADLAIEPRILPLDPTLMKALAAADFSPNVNGQPGAYVDPSGTELDLLVPETLAEGPGTRDARLLSQPPGTARRVKGLEAVLIDNSLEPLVSLDGQDPRSYEIRVAGSGALLVAKVHKIADRLDQPQRLEPKDALDGFRLLRLPSDDLAKAFLTLRNDPLSQQVTDDAIALLGDLFGKTTSIGCELVVRAAAPLEEEEFLRSSCVALTGELLRLVETA